MNFRIVWMGGDDDQPARQNSAQEGIAAIPDALPAFYENVGNEMVRSKRLENGRVKRTPVANFTARIVRDLILDDDAEQRRELAIEAKSGEQNLAFMVSAPEFAGMSWVLRKLGPQAIIYPGQQQHARAAIQYLSGQIPQERIFTHLGWTRLGPDWVYLHARGAVGAQRSRSDVQVELPAALQHYQLPLPASRQALVSAVRASLDCLSVAPDRITFPMMAAVYRAALGKVDFSVFLTGQTGTFKTALAALCQQHFGAALDACHLPGNFASTANALESLAFSAKDALIVVDDFVLTGGPGDGALQGLAERLFRAAGNHQGRSRMGGNGRLRAAHPPRGLILATGEEVPRGQSIRARLLIIEVEPGEVNTTALTQCQRAAQQGNLAESMGAFLSWTASHYEERQQRLKARALEICSQGDGRAIHARLPGALAELQSGWELVLEFAFEVGAINRLEKRELEERNKTAIAELALRQATYQMASDPALRFMTLLRAALAAGRAHVADRHGKAPESPEPWGWRRRATGGRWVPQGPRIGWVAMSDLFLDSAASYQVAQQMAGPERMGVSEQTLRHRLQQRGLLASIDVGRQMLLVRRTLDGYPRQVMHFKASEFL